MRKVLIATIVAMVLFAVGAFAANLALQESELASGTADIVSCTGGTQPTVTFEVGERDDTDWPITGAEVSGIPTACNGLQIEIVVTEGGARGTGTVASGAASLDFGTTGPSYVNPAGEGSDVGYAMRIGGVLV